MQNENDVTVIGQGENTPLLGKKIKKPRTPLPKVQFGIVMFLQLAEPISSMCIYPFINQLVRELNITGGDETKVGYYAGLIESIFFATEALTVMRWSRLSDRIGRKPVILIGLSGLCVSMLAFGLSRTFWTLVISRCICGMLNGNLGVMKSMIAEMTDSTNMAQGFSLIPIVWCVGATIGAFMGGALARPHERFPETFSGTFWEQYPYFLPCAAAAAFTAGTFLLILFFLKETLPNRVVRVQKAQIRDNSRLDAECAHEGTSPHAVHSTMVPIRSLLIPSVTIPLANYGMLAFVEIALVSLKPLYYSTPTVLGGLGFSPSLIGSWIALFGIVDGTFQALFFAPIVDRLGPKRIFMISVACFIPIFMIFPVMSWHVRSSGVDWVIWVLLSCQLALTVIMDMSYGCIFMFIASSAPSKHSLGSVNGMGQTVASIARTIGPAVSTSLFAASEQHHLLGGNAVYLFLVLLTVFFVWLTSRLPGELEDRDEEVK
ncbi:major facilitator superfamily domain-containing protein [Hygrophoropsis aurantiaca]|uniref:Major facilitator superfamily domain-containing protein n=1 Tax=Hygrophoropsis aurantiaca TaxID=72124 RepID=A0ACB7ZSU8_9AGAM|nr:major facilitator superfamily domain-containing protein [Hygrophoropsis aurantiaca]